MPASPPSRGAGGASGPETRHGSHKGPKPSRAKRRAPAKAKRETKAERGADGLLDGIRTWRAAARSFDSPHGAVAYWDVGEGPALLLLHGFPTSSWDWRRVWPRLAPGRRLLALDLPGFGLSTKPPVHVGARAQADLIEALCARLEITSAHAICHDIGGTAVQELLARQGENAAVVRIASAVFVHPALLPEAHRPRPTRPPFPLSLIGRRGVLVSEAAFKRRLAAAFDAKSGRPIAARELNDAWRLHAGGDGSRDGFSLERFRAEQKTDSDRWRAALAAGLAPQRFIFGLADDELRGGALALYRAAAPRADAVELEAAGRYAHLDAPDAVAEAIEIFHASLHAGPHAGDAPL